MSGRETAPAGARVPVVFVAFQTDQHANGGIRSMTHLVERAERVRPILVTQRESPATEAWRARGFEVHVWPAGEITAGPTRLSRALGRLRRGAPMASFNARLFGLLRSTGARVVHCNDVTALWHAAAGARASGARVVFTLRGTTGVRGAKWQLSRSLAHRVVVLSRDLGARLEGGAPALRWPRAGETEVIYSVVDPGEFHPARDPVERARERGELGIEEGAFAVGVVAAFTENKRQRELIEALGRAKAAGSLHPSLRVHFVGDFRPERDPYARECEALVARHGLGSVVRFAGYDPRVARWYRALDAVAVTSRDEGLARCMIEALASATPVVSFPVCSAREVLEVHACGRVVPEGDFAGLLAALTQWATDPSVRAQVAARGPTVAHALFAPAAVVRAYEDVYMALHRRDGPASPRSGSET